MFSPQWGVGWGPLTPPETAKPQPCQEGTFMTIKHILTYSHDALEPAAH